MVDLNLSLTVPAIEKLIDYGASGVGAIAGTMLATRKAEIEGKARLIAADADAGVRQIQAQADANALTIIAEAQSKAQAYLPADAHIRGTLDITPEDIIQSIEFQGRKRLANARAVLEGAADELGDKEVDDHEPDPDWTPRFFDCVQDVSSEDMQKIWAKILAGEVESPGRTSLRTLDTLRNMTRRDAEMFRDVCDFVILNDFVFYEDSVKRFGALRYSNLLHLQDCGLINVGPNLVKMFAWEGRREILIMYSSSALVITRNPEATEKILEIPGILLTTAGKELYQFVQCTPQMEYLCDLAKFLQSKNCQLESLVDAKPLPDGSINHTSSIPITPQSEQVDGAAP